MKIIYSGAFQFDSTLRNSHVFALKKHGYLKEAYFLKAPNNLDLVKTVAPWLNYVRINGIKRLINNDAIAVYKNKIFDKKVSSILKEADIFIGWSGMSKYSIGRARNLGMTTIVFRGSPHIEYCHEQFIKSSGSSIISKINIDTEKYEYKNADYIFVPSNFCKQTFLEYGTDHRKIKVITAGINLNPFNSLSIGKIKNNKIVFISIVGILDITRGIRYVLDAWMKANLCNAELHIVGHIRGNYASNLVRKYSNVNSVKFLGRVQSIPEVLRYSDVFVYMGIWDGFPASIIEASAAGLPLIISDSVGGREMVIENKNGYVVESLNTKDLAEKMKKIVSDKERFPLMGEVSRRISKKYSNIRHERAFIKELENIFFK